MRKRTGMRLKQVRIAVELDVTRYWLRSVMVGVVRYANECGKWQLFTEAPVGLSLIRRNDPTPFDGAIVPAYFPSQWPAATPSVYIGTPLDEVFGPTFSADNTLISRLAADHLIGIGFPNLAFIGIEGTTFSADRGNRFEAELARRKRTCIRFDLPTRTDATYSDYVTLLTAWLDRIPLPCAVLGADAELSGLLITAGREAGLRIPEELAVLGINNDDLWCSSVVPALSSIGTPADEIGWRAAEHLDQLIQGKVAYESKVHRFAPTGLFVRRSTEVVGYDNPTVSEAVLLIRARAPREALTVEQIAQDLQVSRQYLSQCFEKHVGRSVKEEIDRVRIDLIADALHNGKSTPKELVNRMGFSDLSQLSRFCRRLLGTSPRSIPKRTMRLSEL